MSDVATAGPLPAETAGLSRRRRLVAAVVLVVGLPLLTEVLVQQRGTLSYATPVLLVLSLVVAVCLVGGAWVALPAALLGGLVLNWFFTPPYGTLDVTEPAQVVVLLVYLGIAVAVSVIVDAAARRSAEAARARAEAQTLSGLAGATLAAAQTLPDLLERVRATFGMREVRLEVPDPAGVPQVVARAGATGLDGPDVDDEALHVRAGPDAMLVATGPALFAADRRVVASFAEAAGTAYEGRRLAEQAEAAAGLAAADRMRTALLASVGHDLRTPLAAIKAAATSLQQHDVRLSAGDQAELVDVIDAAADRLQGLVTNLLDASRLQAGALSTHPQPVRVEEAASAVLDGLPTESRPRVRLEPMTGMPPVVADPGLLDRVLANLVDNALRHAPGSPVVLTASLDPAGRALLLDVVDHGPGVPEAQHEAIFAPFQRLGDREPTGVGLGLAVAHGFAEAMDGTLVALPSDGGGLTMRLALPVVAEPLVPPDAAGDLA